MKDSSGRLHWHSSHQTTQTSITTPGMCRSTNDRRRLHLTTCQDQSPTNNTQAASINPQYSHVVRQLSVWPMTCRQYKARQGFLRQCSRHNLTAYPIRVTRTDRHDNTANACCNEIDSLIGALFRQAVKVCSDALHKWLPILQRLP